LSAETGERGGKAAGRKARLAETLRANLMKRKAQARARRKGEADGRPEGIAAAKDGKES
jgi:hypothetical protein